MRDKWSLTMFGVSPSEVLIILLVAMLLFGAKRLPEIARSLGRSINEFKRGVHSTVSEIDQEINRGRTPEQKAASAVPKEDEQADKPGI